MIALREGHISSQPLNHQATTSIIKKTAPARDQTRDLLHPNKSQTYAALEYVFNYKKNPQVI